MAFLIAGTLLVAIYLTIRTAANRFAAKARKAGRWDDQGPLVETAGPDHHFRNSSMDERREVIGDWTPPIINDRRPTTIEPTKQNRDHPKGDRD